MVQYASHSANSKEGYLMSIEQNKAIVRRYHDELFNKGNLAVADEVFDPNYLNSAFGKMGLPRGPEGFKQYVSMMRTAYPDFHLTIEDQVAEGDKEVHRVIARGTHKGALMDIAPTNKQVEVSAIAIDQFSGGKVVESWAEVDMFGMMQQLGVITLPG
jgi:predicted ester cyclase